MKRYRCDDCDYECIVEMKDDAPIPDSCVLGLGHGDAGWIKSIIIKESPKEAMEF